MTEPIIHKVWPNGTEEWRLNGKRHRVDGPAITWPNGTESWYLDGKPVTREDVMGPDEPTRRWSEIEWIECDDPERLAAAAAAGVRVAYAVTDDSWWPTGTTRPATFAARIAHGERFRIPSRVVWPPALTVPEGMTPERLRDAAAWIETRGGVGGALCEDQRVDLRRWADDLAAQIEGGGADDEAVPIPAPADPDTWPLAETWEDCARHVEAGGVVEYEFSGDWLPASTSAEAYRGYSGRPGGLSFLRRLVPIPAPAPESSPDGEGLVDLDTAWAECDAEMATAQAVRSGVAMLDGEPVEQWRYDELRAERDALAVRLAAWPEVNPMDVREFAVKIADYVATNINADGMSKRGWAIEAVVQAMEEPTASDEARAILGVARPEPVVNAPAPESSPDGEGQVVRRTRAEITDDFEEGTRTIRKWIAHGAVNGRHLYEELDAWLWYWGGAADGSSPVGSDPLSKVAAERDALAARLAAWPEVPDDGVPRPIDVALIEDERARGWVNFHPENFCHRCGSRNPSWFTDADTFNKALGQPSEHGWGGIVCVACLAELHADATGEDSTWQVSRAGSARSWPEVPDGHEVLVVPSEVVDDWASKREGFWMTERERAMAAICRATVDRRPKRTERVPWWEAKGRTEPAGDVIEEVGSDETGPYVGTVTNDTRLRSPVHPDGTVIVLAEDGES